MPEMPIGKLYTIFTEINRSDFTDEEKATAIYEIMNLPTHNGITKAQMIEVIKYLWHKKYYFAEKGE
jgi:protein-L-isoaspartate O-methyltransferase